MEEPTYISTEHLKAFIDKINGLIDWMKMGVGIAAIGGIAGIGALIIVSVRVL